MNSEITETNSVLFNEFDALPLFKTGCFVILFTDSFLLDEIEVVVYPNPTIGIKFFGNNENVKITFYNTIGVVVKI